VGKAEGRRPLGKPRHMWEDTIKIDLQTIRWGVDYIDVAQYRHRWQTVVNFCLHNMQTIPRLAEEVTVSNKVLCS
jgi:hypothetical protein